MGFAPYWAVIICWVEKQPRWGLPRLFVLRPTKTIFDIIDRDALVARAAVMGEQTIARLKNEPTIQQKLAGVRGKVFDIASIV